MEDCNPTDISWSVIPSYVLNVTAQALSNLPLLRHTTGKFSIRGQIKDQLGRSMPDLFIEAFDSDFGSPDDFLGSTLTDGDGRFEIKSFAEKDYKQENYEIFERRPDVYIVISDEYRPIRRTEIRSEAKNAEYFEITVADTRPFIDPYANSMQRMVGFFGTVGQTVEPAALDRNRTPAQLVATIGRWRYYNDPNIISIYGYPGPQVIRNPKEFPDHSHLIPWRKTS